MENQTISFPALKVTQPIGTFFVGVMNAKDLVNVAVADIRRLEENEMDDYIGIQRRLSPSRSKELKAYVNSFDATFPTSIILAVDEENAEWDEVTRILTLKGSDRVSINEVARIIDGQHRVDGLTALKTDDFEVSVSVFVGADVATQANIFATVNLAQTKVNRSLVYDLLDYEKKRSPQKSAHHIAVALDQLEFSPFFRRIKRLGSATTGREGEPLTQAAVVESLLDFLSRDPMSDRNAFLKALYPQLPTHEEHTRYPFRQLFLKEKDAEITEIMLNYFVAIRERWPSSWDDLGRRGNVLPKTNGFKALMRFLKPVFLSLTGSDRERVPSSKEFSRYLAEVPLEDANFNTTTFPPGTSGEAGLYKLLVASLKDRDPGQQGLFW
ncbi:DGQHR domain-containing protein [Neorhizobium galegae]|uniref:DGQHR domain-containing protein n=1 Tax=Neorhizobium galegae TaxID=399 RepID=UPI0021014B2D|nr:DGQHR domain-containing protein [Neorhizobium galegae]MCQ1572964.1 DGQHR domain-containing protein [Neorhizobium galegae]